MRTRAFAYPVLCGLALLATACSTPSIQATKSIQAGDQFNNSRDYDNAILQYEKYLKLTPQLGLYRNPKMEAQVSRKLSHAHATQGNYQKSILYLQRALTIDSVNGHTLEIAEDYLQLGEVNAYLGDYQKSIACLTQSLSMTKGMAASLKNERRESLARTYLSLARVNLTLGNLKETYVYATDADRLFSKMEEDQSLVEVALILGIVARDRGRLEEAESHVNRSRQLAQKFALNTSRQEQTMGDIFFLRGDPESAVRHKIHALEEAERSRIQPQVLIALNRLGDAYRRVGDDRKANIYYQKALDLQREIQQENQAGIDRQDPAAAFGFNPKSPSTIAAGIACLRMGDSKLKQKQYDSAWNLLNDARSFFQKAENAEGIARTNLLLAKVALERGDLVQSLTFLTEAEKINPQFETTWQVWYGRGKVWEKSQRTDSALNAYRNAIRIIEGLRANLSTEEFKTLFSNEKVEVFDRAIMLLAREGLRGNRRDLVEESFSYNEQSRSRTFLDMLGNKKVDPKNTSDTTLLDREQLLRHKISQLVGSMNSETRYTVRFQQLDRELEIAQFEYEDLLQNLKLRNPAYASVLTIIPPTVSEVQKNLPDKTTVIEYWVNEDGVVVWIIDNHKMTARVLDVSQEKLQREIRRCRNSISARAKELTDQSLSTIYDWLILPIANEIGGSEALIIVPHRGLHLIPFQALAKNDRYLIEDFVVQVSPSIAVYDHHKNKNSKEGDNFLGMALGDQPIGQFSSLPGTGDEVEFIARLFQNPTIRQKNDFTESFFKENAHAYNYLHVATHGSFNQIQPMYSFLLMNPSAVDDGRLTVTEVFGISVDCKLVVLSACETGVGQIELSDDLVGLSRAFLYAGSSNVIVSLWKVDDEVTASLMKTFYTHVRAGRSASESLALAQRDLLQNATKSSISKFRNPYYWAPFILIGNGE